MALENLGNDWGDSVPLTLIFQRGGLLRRSSEVWKSAVGDAPPSDRRGASHQHPGPIVPPRLLGDDFVDEAVRVGFFRVEKAITVGVRIDSLGRLSRVARQDLVRLPSHLQDMARVDFDI